MLRRFIVMGLFEHDVARPKVTVAEDVAISRGGRVHGKHFIYNVIVVLAGMFVIHLKFISIQNHVFHCLVSRRSERGIKNLKIHLIENDYNKI